MWGKAYIYMRKREIDSHLALYKKIPTSNGLKLKSKKIWNCKFLEENIGEKLHDTGLDCNFIDMSTKTKTGETTSN